VVLVSPVTSVGTDSPPGHDPEDLLPTLAAVARFHGRGAYLAQSVGDVAATARGFALGPYAAALRRDDLTPAEREALADQISRFVGISPSAILDRDLKLDQVAFVNLLLRDQQERVGRMDGRVHAPLAMTRAREPPYDDPATTAFTLPYDQALATETFFRSELGFRPANPFVRLNLRAYERWNWRPAAGPVLVPERLGRLMLEQPRLRLLVLLGYYDLAVPFAGVLNAFSKTPVPRDRLETHIFHCGHAVLGNPASRAEAAEDIRRMMRAASCHGIAPARRKPAG
jgi:carboxypeptidase C (cathepsin A)